MAPTEAFSQSYHDPEIDVKRATITAAALALVLTPRQPGRRPEPTADGTVSQDTFLTTHGPADMDAVRSLITLTDRRSLSVPRI